MNQQLVVLDTNILVSALLSPYGPPARVLDLVLAGEVRPAFDDRLLSEYRDVLLRPKFRFDAQDVEALLDFLQIEGEPVVALPMFVTLPDADDLPFLEVAVQVDAILVTGNKAHYDVTGGEITAVVMTPREFLDFWGDAQGRQVTTRD